jgi:hypothetical protein
MKNKINLLDKEFTGKGEVLNMRFLQLYMSEKAYIYQVADKHPHYEVFERKTTPLCIDFKNKIYSETEFKEYYPNSKSFGVWAWTFNDLNKAIEKFNEISK